MVKFLLGFLGNGDINMEHIFYRKNLICAIAKEQSFSKAAQKLFIAQSSLSLMVKNLEESLGVSLFDRSCMPIQLTEAGRVYIKAAEQIQEIEAAYEEYIHALTNLDIGSLRIGSNQLLSTLVLPQYISRFIQAYPKIHLSFMDANSTTLENAISSGTLDLIVDNRILASEVFEQIHLATEHLLLAVPAAFAENEACKPYRLIYQDILQNRHTEQGKPVPLSFFSSAPFILMNRDNDIRKQTNAIFQEMHFSPQVLFEMDRLTSLYTYVAQGTAATVVSDTLVRNIQNTTQDQIVYYMLPTKYNTRSIYASYKRNKHCTPAMSALIEILKELPQTP